MKGENRFSNEQLKRYAEKHLSREVELLRWNASFLNGFFMSELSFSQVAGDIANALRETSLDSFAMHARNLIDLLYLRNHFNGDRSTDIVIEDYLGEDVVEDRLIGITDNLERAKTKADKLVAHLSMQRETFSYYEKSWIYSQVAVDLLEALRSVIYEIPDELQSDRLKEAVSDSLPLVFDLRLSPFAEDDERGPGIAISYGQYYMPDTYLNQSRT